MNATLSQIKLRKKILRLNFQKCNLMHSYLGDDFMMQVDMLTSKINLLMKKLENPGLDHLRMVDARVTCEECGETGPMGIHCPMVSQDITFVGNSNNGLILIKASMVGGTNPISRLTTANKVVWGRTSTEVNLLSRILFGVS
jgi:hypothetical protein